MNYDILASEIRKEKYIDLSDEDIAVALNEKIVLTVNDISTTEIAAWAVENGVMVKLHMIDLSSDAPTELRAVVRTLLTVLEKLDSWRILGGDHKLSLAAQTIIDVLIRADIVTREQVEELIAMATKRCSWSELYLGSMIGSHHIAEARRYAK